MKILWLKDLPTFSIFDDGRRFFYCHNGAAVGERVQVKRRRSDVVTHVDDGFVDECRRGHDGGWDVYIREPNPIELMGMSLEDT
jgi:hypothetical protein